MLILTLSTSSVQPAPRVVSEGLAVLSVISLSGPLYASASL